MSEQAKTKFELSAEEESLLRTLRNQGAIEPTDAEQKLIEGIRQKRLEAAAKAAEPEPPVTLEEIRPGLPPEKLSTILRKLRALAS
ncbi:MAG: hypothetical protein ACE141_06025 [Bryobacteraceae bacterium]